MKHRAYTRLKDHLFRPAKRALLVLRIRLLACCWALRCALPRRRVRGELGDVRRVAVGPFRAHGRVVDHYTAAGAAAEDLAAVTGMLEDAALPYFLVSEPGARRHVLGVEEVHRRAVLELAARCFRDTPGYVAAVGDGGRLLSLALWADGGVPRAVLRAQVLRTGTVRLGPGGQVLHGVEGGCEVEFWRRGASLAPVYPENRPWLSVPARQLGDDFAAALLSPRRNRVSEVVPATAQQPVATVVGGHRIATFQPFADPGVDEVRFPVDVVYTWVDGDDPAMAAKRGAYGGEDRGGIADRETGPSRYTSHDELRFSLRSLDMYAPFVRHVYLVTDGQIPEWLDPASDWVTVVDHREILPADALPVFNSHAIESRLHHIPGLSDRYLYFNDDVFVNRPVRAESFFHGNGLAKLPFSPYKLGLGHPYPLEPAPNSAGKNARELVRRTFGRHITAKFQHVPHPQLLAVLREIEAAGFEEFRRTAYSRFRSTRDVASAATLHHHWALLTGRAVPAEYTLRYADLGSPDLRERLARLERGEDVDFFCVNDVDTTPGTRAAAGPAVHAFLERRFPFPGRAERSGPAVRLDGPAAAKRLVTPHMDGGRPVRLQASA
ncbi:hypothetical protein E4198_03245 [Streptomyces sp. RKND-216]|uniref:stealth conserved region 3 domain-containing protein n=1 Tax=Streptomyces sp. RKND-216 TaxID=2562581 RepID=UPI00109DFC2C|nr:stealth conserved region 3 domain-containing protein [Streptomyces sp. RKND-216]THA23875.1 hypothetical protein E4198_03245 [Streptomyces sp. RKND-216]